MKDFKTICDEIKILKGELEKANKNETHAKNTAW